MEHVLQVFEHPTNPHGTIDVGDLVVGLCQADALGLATHDAADLRAAAPREQHVPAALVLVVEGDRLELLPGVVGSLFCAAAAVCICDPAVGASPGPCGDGPASPPR